MTRKGMGSHQSTRAGSTVWLTPPGILEALGQFDLDPCAAPTPRPWPTAARHLAPPEDGLSAEWHGRVWVNPPYGNAVGQWLAKLAEHGTGTALVFARTETVWFADQVWQRATAVLFLYGRLTFRLPDGGKPIANSGAPSCLVAYGSDDAEQLRRCGLPGAFVPLGAQAVAG